MRRFLALLLLIPALAFGQTAGGIMVSQQRSIVNVTGMGTSCGTFLITPTSANLRACLTDESGTGAALFAGGALGTPASGVATNLTGTAAGLTAGTVTTNANLTGPITSTGNATAIASQTGTGTKFVVDTSPVLVTPTIGAAVATSISMLNAAVFDDAVNGLTISTVATIYTSATHAGAPTANLSLVFGTDHATNAVVFTDVVLWVTGGATPVTVSSAVNGSPATRTYTISSTALLLAMGGGATYDVSVKNTRLGL